MKQRIEELVNQSKFFANDERRYLERVHNREYSQDEWQDICFEKFAELLIRECVNIAYEYDKPKLSGPGLAIASNIESHFDIYIEEDGRFVK